MAINQDPIEIVTLDMARENGLRKYFTGKPCKNGHISERRTINSDCITCARQIVAKYHIKNREKLIENSRSWYILKMNEEGWKDKKNQLSRDHWAKRRAAVLEKYGNKCVCCQTTIEPFLTIDHINDDGNIDRKKPMSVGGGRGAGLYKRLFYEPADHTKYRIYCYNCNLGRDKTVDGICPHRKPLQSSQVGYINLFAFTASGLH